MRTSAWNAQRIYAHLGCKGLRQFVMPRLISWYDLAAYTCVENLEDFSFSNFGYERRTSTWKYGWSGVIGSFKVTGNKTIRECIVSRFRDIASYSLKAVHFLLPMFFPFFQRQPLIELTSKFYRDAWRQKKLNFWGVIAWCCLRGDMFSRFDRTPARVGQMDRRTKYTALA